LIPLFEMIDVGIATATGSPLLAGGGRPRRTKGVFEKRRL